MTAKKTTGKSSRTLAARLAAVQALYDIEMTEHGPHDVIAAFTARGGSASLEGEEVPADPQLFADIVRGVEAERAALDEMIVGAGRAGRRVEALLQSVLRAGAFELWRHPTVDAPLVISHYLSVAAAFYERAEVGLVNGVLDALAKRLRAGAGSAPEAAPDPQKDPLEDPLKDPLEDPLETPIEDPPAGVAPGGGASG